MSDEREVKGLRMMYDTSWIPDAKPLREHVVEYSFHHPELFLRALHPRCGLWGLYEQSWIFRGHADSSWPLFPSAARAASWEPFGGIGPGAYLPAVAKVQERIDWEIGA